MKKVLVILGISLSIFAGYVTFFSPTPDLLHPLGSPLEPRIRNLESKSYVVLGFAPYWNLKKLSPESLKGITHFAYFHLLLNADGSVYTKTNKREEEPGYTNYKRLISGNIDRGTKPLTITFMPESQNALSSSINSSVSRQKTTQTIINIVTESGANGVNIDYEPLGDSPRSVRDNFTIFISELRTELDKLGGSSKLLTISIYGSAGANPRIWDLQSLSAFTDYFVVMTYDYTMPGSNSAGPNSPLRGSGNLFEHDIVKNIAEISKLVPSQKLLLGIPFYGYEWDTVDTSKYSPVEAKGSVASLDRIQKMLDEKTLELIWDRNSLTPYGIATISGQTSQIYFENATSIELKLGFVRSAGLGGIAIWALGYETTTPWIWPTIAKLNR